MLLFTIFLTNNPEEVRYIIQKEYSITIPLTLLDELSISATDCLFFDIETTGLSWKTSHLYLLGSVFYDGSHWVHKQWFCQKPSEEKEVLSSFLKLLQSKKVCIHFNGSTFDLPYLMHKCTFYQLDFSWDQVRQLDLYKLLSPYKKWLGLTHFRQKNLEEFMGLFRKDPFSGGELISLYQDYLRTGDPSLLHILLLHNKEDVEGMVALCPLLSLPHRLHHPFLDDVEIQLEEHRNDADIHRYLQIKLLTPLSFPFQFTCETPRFTMAVNNGFFFFRIPIFQGVLRYYFPDYENYYYLPLENRAIHKSVALYVDKAHREKAKASTCFQPQTGDFLPQFSDFCNPSFRSDYKEKEMWFLFSDDKDITFYQNYASYLLSNVYSQWKLAEKSKTQ